MSAIYRQSRNLEASLIQYIEAELVFANWTGITVEKSFKKVYGIPVDTFQKHGAICVRLSDTNHDKAQVGDNSTVRKPTFLVDVFAANDGQRLDCKDFLVHILKGGFPYYEYEVNGNTITNKTQNGRVRVTNIDDTEVNLGVDKNLLDSHDKYRHLISLTCNCGKIEV